MILIQPEDRMINFKKKKKADFHFTPLKSRKDFVFRSNKCSASKKTKAPIQYLKYITMSSLILKHAY